MRKDVLFITTLVYLLAPVVIFAVGWLRPALAAAVVIAVGAGLAHAARRSTTSARPIAGGELIFVLAFAAFWTYTSGIGELNLQTSDYFKHNLVFRDLAVNRWPVVYADAGRGDPLLCYYLAYYLPAGLAGKLAGVRYAAAASCAWGGAGLALAFAWVCRYGRPYGVAVLVAFTLIDGFCWLPGLIPVAQRAASAFGLAAPPAPGGWFVAEFWRFRGPPTSLLFDSAPGDLLWVPQHTLAAWLGAAVALRTLWDEHTQPVAALPAAALLLWSPFAAVGVLPFLAAALWRTRRRRPSLPDVIAALAVALPVGAYFASHLPLEYAGVLVAALAGAGDWLRYALFLILSIGVLWGVAALARRHYRVPDDPRWSLLCLASATLAATTLVYVGRYNDWTMRTSMPALAVMRMILAITAVELWRSAAPLRHRLAFCALLLLSAERSLKYYLLAPLGASDHQLRATTIATADTYRPSLARLDRDPAFDFAAQYLGRRGSVFCRFLMKDECRVRK